MSKRKKLIFPGFKRCLEMMRSRNAAIQEDGFYFLAPHANEYLDELIAAFQTEEDNSLRSWLLELIAGTKSPQAFPILVEYVCSSESSLYRWAKSGLKALNTPSEGRRLLWEACLYGRGMPSFATEEQSRHVREELALLLEAG